MWKRSVSLSSAKMSIHKKYQWIQYKLNKFSFLCTVHVNTQIPLVQICCYSNYQCMNSPDALSGFLHKVYTMISVLTSDTCTVSQLRTSTCVYSQSDILQGASTLNQYLLQIPDKSETSMNKKHSQLLHIRFCHIAVVDILSLVTFTVCTGSLFSLWRTKNLWHYWSIGTVWVFFLLKEFDLRIKRIFYQ